MSSQGWEPGVGVPSISISDTAFSRANIIVNTTFNILSIVGGLFVVFVTFALWLYDRRLMDRVSLRLNAAISAIDAIRSAVVLAYTYMNEDTPKHVCVGSAWLIIFSADLYLFLSASVAFNLQWVVLQENRLAPWMEQYLYYGGSLVLALIFSCIPLIVGRFGWDEAQSMCWYRQSWKTSSIVWEWVTYLGPAVVVIVYCNVVVGLVINKIVSTNRKLRKNIGSSRSGKISNIQRNTQRAINRVLGRIVLYPFIPFITQTPFIASEAYMHSHGEINKWLSLFGNIATDSPGILNFFAFLIDPSLYSALDHVKRDLISKYAQPATIQMADLSLETGNSPVQRSGFMYWFVNRVLYRPNKPMNLQVVTHTIPSASRQSWHALVEKEDHSPTSTPISPPPVHPYNHYSLDRPSQVSTSQSAPEDEHLGPSAARRFIQHL